MEGERYITKKTVGKWPSAVRGKDVGSNSIQCTNSQRWVHKTYCFVKDSLCKASVFFLCSVCLCPADREVKSCVDIGDGSSVELVDEFCSLGDRHTDAAVIARICNGWFKFRSLASFLTAIHILVHYLFLSFPGPTSRI